MQLFGRISKSLLLWAASLVLFSCEEPNWDFDPYSDNLGPGYSAFGFYSEGVKYINAVFEESYLFSVSHEIQMNWNRCIEDGEAGIFMKIDIFEKEDCMWEDKEGNHIGLGPYVLLHLPLEKISLGKEITVENPNNAINLRLHAAGEENWYRNTISSRPFKKLTVIFTDVSKDQICGTFNAEIEVENLQQNTTINLKNGVFFLRADRRYGTYKSWLEDSCRTVNW